VGSEPFDQYATTEAGFVAAECTAHAGLHVLDDHVVVEVVDEAGAPVPDGTYGHHVLLTALHSRTLPLVRYRLDDVVALTEAGCPCGRPGPRLLGVAGRARELLHLPAAAGGGEVTVHPVAVTSVLDPLPVNGWQVVAEPGRLVVRLLEPVHAEVPQAVRDGLARALGAAGAELR
jgi:phenylacetate-coenzyme A ligase PaaK-like adenylate-forming protein